MISDACLNRWEVLASENLIDGLTDDLAVFMDDDLGRMRRCDFVGGISLGDLMGGMSGGDVVGGISLGDLVGGMSGGDLVDEMPGCDFGAPKDGSSLKWFRTLTLWIDEKAMTDQGLNIPGLRNALFSLAWTICSYAGYGRTKTSTSGCW